MMSHYFYRRAASPTHISKLIPALEFGELRMQELAKETGMSYLNIVQSMQDAEKEELIIRKMVKNNWEIKLTEKGKALLTLCKGIRMVIEDWTEDTPKNLARLKFNEETEKKEVKNDIVRNVGEIDE